MHYTHAQILDLVQHTYAEAGYGCTIDEAEATIRAWQQAA